jgi:DNA-3-methyladenine glycosylase II
MDQEMNNGRVPDYWDKAKAHLLKVDPQLAELIQKHEEPALRSKGDLFETLIRSIVGQQISGAAADAIWKRLNDLVGPLNTKSLVAVDDQELRNVGLSFRKIEYVRSVAAEWPRLSLINWNDLSDEQVKKELTALRGIGPWTADMILMFNLLRPDVLPLGDLGVVKMMERLYANGDKLSTKELKYIGEQWAPFRTVASWYLWRGLDPEPVEY